MSEARDISTPNDAGAPNNYASGGHMVTPGSPPLLLVGGGLGIAGSFIGLAIFLGACAGFGGVLPFSIAPLVLAVPGFVLSMIAALTQKHLIKEDTHVMAALFANVLAIIGGLLELAVWQNWHMFAK